MSASIFHIYIDEVAQTQFAVGSSRVGQREPVLFQPTTALHESIRKLHSRGIDRFVDIYHQDAESAAVGETLFTTFIGGFVLAAYRDYRQAIDAATGINALPRIAIHLPRSLQYLPWELLKDPSEQLVMSLKGSVIRYDAPTEPKSMPIAVSPTADGTPQFVVIASNPTNDPTYNFSFEKKYGSAKFDEVTPAEFERLRSRLAKDTAGIIFFGHGEVIDNEGYLSFVKKVPGAIFATLERDRRSAHVIAKELGAVRTPRIACVLACESALLENAVAFERTVAGSLVTSTPVTAVVGAQEKIDQKALMQLLRTCIKEFVAGVPLDLSVRAARLDILAIDPNEKGAKYSRFDWWIPALYARTENLEFVSARAAKRRLPAADRQAVKVAASSLEASIGPTVRQIAARVWETVRIPSDVWS